MDRWIAVTPNNAPIVPSIGDNLRIICQVAEDSPYTDPKWLGPDNEEERPLGSSKSTHFSFGFEMCSQWHNQG